MDKIYLIIILMAVVTYTPRALPAILTKYISLNKTSERFLKLVPYTAMGALVFPGILTVGGDNIIIGIVGGATAVLFSLWFNKLAITILSAIVAVMAVQYLIV